MARYLNLAQNFVVITILSNLFIADNVCYGTLQCYKCDSTLDVNCQEAFDPETFGLDPVDCASEVYQGKFCIKTTGMFGGKPGTRRFCSSKNLGNICNYLQRPNEQIQFRACVYTCTGNLCNSAATNRSLLGLALLCAFIALFL